MLSAKLLWSLLALSLILPSFSLAQSFTGYNWYFGGQYGISFSRSDGSATLINNHATLGTGGAAVANDATNGDLLFYTDGNIIYDRTHTAMANGTGLGANTSGNQPVVIAKVPGQDNQYYVFVNTANGTAPGSITYRIVDMSLAGNAAPSTPPAGTVISPGNVGLVPPLTASSEGMLIVPHSNGDNFWLITHVNGSTDYNVTLITPAGPQPTTTVPLGSISSVANFSYHPGTNRIAVSPEAGNQNVEVLNFNNTTGVLSLQQAIPNSGVASTTNPAVYDTEWSANGQYLYISRTGDTGVQADVLQYDLNTPGSSLASVLPPTPAIANSYGLQMGPDSSIYHIYQATAGGPYLIGQISDTDSVSNLVQYTPQAFPGPPPVNFGSTQFPSFAPKDTVDINVSFTSQGTCANAPTAFFPTVAPPADSLVWDFGDGSGSSDWSPIYTYQQGGTYDVTVLAYLNGQVDSATVQITIDDFETQINLVQDTTGCSEDFPFPKDKTKTGCTSGCFTVTAQVNAGNGGQPQLQWYGPSGLLAGETSASLSPDSAGYYYVVATVGGCQTHAGVNIKEYLVEDQRANIWYFGNSAGLDFNPLPENPVKAITNNNTMNAPEGTATISDRNGQVIIYTDGYTLWDRDNNVIATDIGGAPPPEQSTQSALIIPVPGDETLYYIFTTQPAEDGTYEVRYSLYDLVSGTLREQNVLLFARSTERITGNANWLIAHEAGNNSFRAYQITQQGISNPVISSVGSVHAYTPPENLKGYMKLSPTSGLAVALSTPGVSNVIEIFDFVDSTGVISNVKVANLNNPTGQVYGIEFSPAGNKLFATLQGASSSQIVEFALDSLNRPTLLAPPYAPVNEKLGAIQMGPDGQIYVAVEGESYLGTIIPDPVATDTSQFNLEGFQLLPGTVSGLGLPNFIQTIVDPVQGPGLSITNLCVGDSTQFFASGKDPSIDKFNYYFGDGTSLLDAGPQVTHVYATAGTYTVNVIVTNPCESYPIETPPRQITIHGVPPDPTGVMLICNGSEVMDANPTNVPNLTYVWSTGDSTETVVPPRQGNYNVTVTNAAGCSTDGTIRAVDNRPIVDLGPNLTICQNTPVAALDAQNPATGNTYAWTIKTLPAETVVGTGSSQRQNVNTALAGMFEYEVTVTDGQCSAKDSVIFTINPLPVITPPMTANPSDCGLNDGSISFNITAPPNSVFSYNITGPTPSSGNNQPTGAAILATGLDAGTYGINVTNQITGCALIDTETLNDASFTATTTQVGTCDPLQIRVTPVGAPAYPISYRVVNAATAQQVVPPTSVAAGPAFFDTPGLPSGNYVVEITANDGCRFSQTANLTQNTPVDVNFDLSQICSGIVTATGTGATSFDWSESDPGSLMNPGTSDMVTVNPGTWTLRVLSNAAPGSCPGRDSITVTIDNYTPSFVQSSSCEDQVTLTASPASGPYTYRWFRNGVQIPGGRIISATVADDNAQYYVQVVSTRNGCIKQSPATAVQVDGALIVSLTTTTPCEGSNFTLTATPNRSASFQWSFEGGLIQNEIGPTHVDNRAGLYTVKAISGSCSDDTSLQIDLAPSTPGQLVSEAFICPDPANPDPNTRSVLLDPGDFASYDWYRNGVPLGITDPTYRATEPGTFTVNLINSFGCPSSDKTDVIEECDPVIVGPNAFRPTSTVTGLGGDKVNQAFKLFTFFIDDEDFQVFIFNRWGEMIFQSPERDFKWNGGYNNNLNQLAPAGTYTYVVRYKSSYRPEEGIQEKRGGVVLLR